MRRRAPARPLRISCRRMASRGHLHHPRLALATVVLLHSLDSSICQTAVDCAGSWSTCTSSCEVASARSWSETIAPAFGGAACRAAEDCTSGEGSCGVPPIALTASMLTVSSHSPNIALNRPALQSTLSNGDMDDGTEGSYSVPGSAKAVDGDDNTLWGGGSCTSTQLSGGSGSDNPWWRVDLGATYTLGSVAILHRVDCCSERMEGAVIYGSDADSIDAALVSVPCGTSTHVTGGRETIECAADASPGRYVFVVVPFDGRILQMCEFEAFAANQGVESLVDDNAMTVWRTDWNAVPAWIEADLGAATRVVEYSIRSGASADYAIDSPTAVALRGSADQLGFSWVELHNASNLVWSEASQRVAFPVSPATAYRYFQIYFAHSNGSVILSEIEIVGRQLSCADLNADGSSDDRFDCSSHANLIHISPEDVSCAADPCTATECCTVSCQPTLSVDPPMLVATSSQPFSVRTGLNATDSRCIEPLISFDWAVSAVEYEHFADKKCSGYQEHNNAGETLTDAVAMCDADASCGGISDHGCDTSWFTLCDAGSTMDDDSLYCSYGQVSSTVSLAGVRLDGPILTFPAFTLLPLGNHGSYWLSVTASTQAEVFTSQATVAVQPLPLVASILGPRRRTVRSTSSLILDASASFDQDVAPSLRSVDIVEFHWTCVARASNSNCTQNDLGILVSNTSELYVEVAAQTGTFDLTVEVAKVGKASAAATTTVVVVGQEAPTVTVEPLSKMAQFNTESTLSVVGEVIGDVTSWEWTVTNENGDTLQVAPDQTLTQLEGTSAGIASLVLTPGIFAAGTVYTFRLTARASDVEGYGELELLANVVPLGGVLRCSPTTGYAIETAFNLRTDGWTDDDDDQAPLSYRFGISQPSGAASLSDFSASPAISAILPRGETNTDLLVVFVEARDIYLGVGDEFTTITVHEAQMPMSDFVSATDLLLSTSPDVHITSQLISSLAATLNSNQRGGSSSLSVQDAGAARTSMIGALETVFDAAIQNPTAESLGRVAANLAGVVQEPQELTQDAADKALSVLEDLCAAGEQIGYPTDAVARATSLIMDSIYRQQGSAAQDQERGGRLSTIINSLGNRLGLAAVDGQLPSVLIASRFKLTVARDTPSSFERRSLSQGAVIVPNGALTGVTDQSVLAQVVEYDSGGPLFYTPDQIMDGSAAQQASGVTSVSFKGVDRYAPVGRRALQSVGGEVTIVNLTEPFLITIALHSSRPDYSINAGNLTMEEVELYISRLWNRSILQAEALAVSGVYTASCAAYVNETAYLTAVQEELEKLQLRAKTEKLICPSKPDSCNAATAREKADIKEKAIPGCKGVRGGADDCAFYPEACACFRGLLRIAYTTESLLCTHWDGTRWNNDGILVRQTETSATCAFTHLTSFKNFVGPPPNFNRMSVTALFDKEWVANNPVSAIAAFATLGLSILTTALAIRVYNDLIREVTTAESARNDFETRTSEFVRHQQLLGRDNVSWFQQLAIKLRTDWPLGALVLGFRGDPFLKTQRLLVLWGSLLIGMVLNVLFFTMPDPNCYADCPDETYTDNSTECSDLCDRECRGNGLLASVVSALFSIPVCGTLNLVFAWLRRPFNGDLALKKGLIGQAIRERASETRNRPDQATDTETAGNVKQSRCAHRGSLLVEWIASKKRCIRATCPCFCHHQVYPDFDTFSATETLVTTSSTSETTPSYDATERAHLAAIVVAKNTARQQNRRRRYLLTAAKLTNREAGHKRREHEILLEQMWEKYDPEQTGQIHRDKLRSLVEDLNHPDPVSDEAVTCIIEAAGMNGSGAISRGEVLIVVPLYIALQQELMYADNLFDQFKSEDDELPMDQLSWILAEVSGIAPSQSELVWTVNMATRSTSAGSSSVDTSPMPSRSTVTRMEVRRAIAVWAPHVHKRPIIPPPPKVFVGNPNSRRYKVRQQMEQIEEQLKSRVGTAILTSQELRGLMKSLNEGESISDVALSSVLHAANITAPECIHADEVIPALALFIALRTEQELIDAKFGEYDSDQSGALSKAQLTHLLADLDGGKIPSEHEVDWVMKTSATGEHSLKALGHAELRRAVALWFPRVMTRRAIEEDVKRASGRDAGLRRKAAAAQLLVHQLWVQAALQTRQQYLLHNSRLAYDSDGQIDPGTISRRELRQLMQMLAGVHKVSSDEVAFVLLLADHPATEARVMQSDAIRPLAMWRGLQEEMDFIEARFHSFDTNNSGLLDREQLSDMVKDVNGGHAASPEEIDWMLSLSTDGKNLTYMQSRLAITIWFYHVAPLDIKVRAGKAMLIPFVYTLVACTAAAVVVAATTVLFSEQKTKEWLAAVGMSLVWRNFLIDPLKTVMCGDATEFVFALIFGGCAPQEASVGLLQGEIEGQGEAVADGADDVVAGLADDDGEQLVSHVGAKAEEGEQTTGADHTGHGDSDDDIEHIQA